MPSSKSRRSTPQRRIILEELCGLKTHPTATELYEIVRKRLPRISLGTVYRNLEVLAQDGRVCKLETSGAEARFDATMTPHYHIRCQECGKVRDWHGELPGDVAPYPREMVGFLVRGHRLEFYGICGECRRAQAQTA
ncbi:MAG: transcriptional repressor, partial [Anaerolineae bacterium]